MSEVAEREQEQIESEEIDNGKCMESLRNATIIAVQKEYIKYQKFTDYLIILFQKRYLELTTIGTVCLKYILRRYCTVYFRVNSIYITVEVRVSGYDDGSEWLLNEGVGAENGCVLFVF